MMVMCGDVMCDSDDVLCGGDVCCMVVMCDGDGDGDDVLCEGNDKV